MSLNAKASVEYIRDDVAKMSLQWSLIKDCIDGETAVKSKRTTYLPNPSNAAIVSEDEQNRYNSYILRANFYNATRQTLKGLIGQVFTRNPLIEAPTDLDLIISDVDGSSIDLTQLSKIGVNLTLAYGRSGILVDYSSNADVLTKAELEKGSARAVLRIYNPWDIINWRYETDDSNKRRLSLVVLKENYIEKDDGFSYTLKTQYRELRLVDNIYRVRIWRSNNNRIFNYTEIFPKDANGNNFDKILFTFIGAENNTGDIDNPPLYDLASINIAHYRNSADYEESIFMVGQPTPVVTGLDESWAKDVLKGGFVLGSRIAVPLPKNADFKLVAAEPNGLVKEAMDHKERQMVALGAKLVEQRQVQRTATEAGIEASSEGSTLVSVASNVSAAVTQALMWACEFQNITSDKIKFILNTDFALNKMSPQELSAIIKSWIDGAISWEEMRSNIRKGNIELVDDNVAKSKIEEENAKALEEAKQKIELQQNNQNNPNNFNNGN